jgi:hypothetical protein
MGGGLSFTFVRNDLNLLFLHIPRLAHWHDGRSSALAMPAVGAGQVICAAFAAALGVVQEPEPETSHGEGHAS